MSIYRTALWLVLFLLISSCSELFGPDIGPREINLDQISEEIDSFASHDLGEGSFLVFLTDNLGADEWASFAQVSFEDGTLGVDHILSIELHERSSKSFIALAEDKKLNVIEKSGNDVRYLRVEGANLSEFVLDVLTEVHGLNSSDTVLVFGELEDAT